MSKGVYTMIGDVKFAPCDLYSTAVSISRIIVPEPDRKKMASIWQEGCGWHPFNWMVDYHNEVDVQHAPEHSPNSRSTSPRLLVRGILMTDPRTGKTGYLNKNFGGYKTQRAGVAGSSLLPIPPASGTTLLDSGASTTMPP